GDRRPRGQLQGYGRGRPGPAQHQPLCLRGGQGEAGRPLGGEGVPAGAVGAAAAAVRAVHGPAALLP
ncbi:hypothetical protein CRUP_011396, partial [Coryphaenoides rupestris]